MRKGLIFTHIIDADSEVQVWVVNLRTSLARSTAFRLSIPLYKGRLGYSRRSTTRNCGLCQAQPLLTRP